MSLRSSAVSVGSKDSSMLLSRKLAMYWGAPISRSQSDMFMTSLASKSKSAPRVRRRPFDRAILARTCSSPFLLRQIVRSQWAPFPCARSALIGVSKFGRGEMRLAQITDENGKRALVVTARGESRLVKGARTTVQLAQQAIEAGASLKKLVAERGVGKPVNLAAAYKEGRVLLPVDLPDPA